MTDEKVYAALVSLRGNPDFSLFMRWVEEKREDAKEKMVLAPIERVPTFQGAAIAFKSILDAVEQAPDAVKRMKTV